jgi:hypothetical protein
MGGAFPENVLPLVEGWEEMKAADDVIKAEKKAAAWELKKEKRAAEKEANKPKTKEEFLERDLDVQQDCDMPEGV